MKKLLLVPFAVMAFSGAALAQAAPSDPVNANTPPNAQAGGGTNGPSVMPPANPDPNAANATSDQIARNNRKGMTGQTTIMDNAMPSSPMPQSNAMPDSTMPRSSMPGSAMPSGAATMRGGTGLSPQ